MNDDVPLEGWAIVQAHGLTLIGKLQGESLSPVYELKPQMGQQGVGHLVVPVWLLGIREAALPVGCLVERCENFSPMLRRHLNKAVEEAERMVELMRAHDAGIVIAKPEMKNGPPDAVRIVR